ncbi:hypothetical protein ACMX2H_18320 [Arthrobacter sulfonylureivorans]|uniref:hypothetical protein n=1 Tax=Arthrobacter sulfonylureivorans TaxID=2486855 RepID=UPI0039E619D4
MKITGTISIDNRATAFTLDHEGAYQQFGGDRSAYGERVDLLSAMGEAVEEWASDNLCRECHDHTLDDGEGYDGRCGDCADRHESIVEEDEDAGTGWDQTRRWPGDYSDWKEEVVNGDTLRSFTDWLDARQEADKEDADER